MPIYSPTGFLDVTNATLRTSNLEAENFKLNGGNIYVSTEFTPSLLVNGNVTSNIVQFTNATTGIVTTANVQVGGRLDVTGDVHATQFHGDGSQLAGVGLSKATTLGTTKEFVVTASGGHFYIDGVQQDSLELHEGQTYLFDLTSTGTTHPFRLATVSDGGGGQLYSSYPASDYTTGTDYTSVADHLKFTVPVGAPSTLYYYCMKHAGMGGSISISTEAELIVSGRVVTSGNVEVGGEIISLTKSATGGSVSGTVHTFTSSGVFEVTGADINVEFLIIGGGGGGGRNHAGGGGAGHCIGGNNKTLPRGVYPITVGMGGVGGNSTNGHGENGGDTHALGFTARGGGGGGSRNHASTLMTKQRSHEGWDGGSGGGGAGTAIVNTDTVTYFGQGANTLGYSRVNGNLTGFMPGGYGGGTGSSSADGTNAGNGGGGGGAGGKGGDATGSSAGAGISGNGGVGVASSITGTSVTYAGGGSGGRWGTGTVGTTNGGGGAGGNADGVSGTNGTNGLGGGGGGGGGGNGDGGIGGNGVVIIKWT